MSRVALFFSFIFAVAAGVSYFTGWACDPSGGCTNSQMLGGAAGIMFLAYLVFRSNLKRNSEKLSRRGQ